VQFETDCLAYELRQLPGIPDEALVLDAGCGTGRYAAGGTPFFYTNRHGWYDVVPGGARTIAKGIGAPLCSRVIYGGSRLLRLDPRAPTMILDELFVPIRFAFSEDTVRGWLARSGVPIASIRPIRHAQFGNLQLPVNRRTRFLHRVLPKNGVIALGVQTAPRAR
jgi:SAM-dependent methyltransferase